MLKVLLVDDESRVLRHLQTAVSWTQFGMEVVFAASNGMEALLYSQANDVDILVTDIRMPGMDGLELCKNIKGLRPNIQIIILSGYSDFEYAKQAIALQVLGYCLKPIDIGDFSSLLRTASKKIIQEKAFSGDLVLDYIEDEDYDSLTSLFHDVGLSGHKIYLAASVNVHNIGAALGAVFTHKLGKHKYLYLSDVPFHKDAAEKIIAFTKEKGGIGILPEAVSLSNLSAALDEVLAMAFQYFLAGYPTLCTALSNEVLANDIFTQLDTLKTQPKELKNFIQDLSSANCSMIFDIRSAFQFYNRTVSSECLAGIYDHDEVLLYGYEQLPVEYRSFKDLLQDVESAINILSPLQTSSLQRENVSTDNTPKSFLTILKYLDANYEKDISLKIISEEFHLNANYISQLIKSETGLTYTQYLTELRITKAKELLTTTALSLNEISEAVGFNDYFYFIKKFKKMVGVTPGKYRNRD